MLTTEQREWINHLSDDNKIEIYPYDPTAPDKFKKIKTQIQTALGKNAKIELRGTAGLKISGQKELDIYIPVPTADFNDYVDKIALIFDKPRSCYFLKRARFVIYIKNTKAEIFVINQDCNQWVNCLKLEDYLIKNPSCLKEYEKLKESCRNLSTREYYRRKTEFINKILTLI